LQQISKSDTPSSSERLKIGKIRKATELYRCKPNSLKFDSLILAFWGDILLTVVVVVVAVMVVTVIMMILANTDVSSYWYTIKIELKFLYDVTFTGINTTYSKFMEDILNPIN
jgi:hypothetical protein